MGANIIPVILSGGCGERLWPLSTKNRPKQFLPLMKRGRTLFQNTCERALGITDNASEHILVLTIKDIEAQTRRHIAASYQDFNARILCEPEPRNTAAAYIYAALYIERFFSPDTLMLMLPSDHNIEDEAGLQNALNMSADTAKGDSFVTFGIRPSYPATLYGYIKAAKETGSCAVKKVSRFVEKPCDEKALEYVNNGHYLWNSGILLCTAKTMIRAYKQRAPDILQLVQSAMLKGGVQTPDWEIYSQIPHMQFEHAVFEAAENIVVMPCDIGWSDIGSWQSLWNFIHDDEMRLPGGLNIKKVCVPPNAVIDVEAGTDTDRYIILVDGAAKLQQGTLLANLKTSRAVELSPHGTHHIHNKGRESARILIIDTALKSRQELCA